MSDDTRTKTTLTDLAKRAGLLPVICYHCGVRVGTEEALRKFVDELTRALDRGEDVYIHGFGHFRTFTQKAHTVTTLATGPTEVPETRYARFSSSRVLKDALNGRREPGSRMGHPAANGKDPKTGKFTRGKP